MTSGGQVVGRKSDKINKQEISVLHLYKYYGKKSKSDINNEQDK